MTILKKSENVIQTDKHNDSVSLDKNASLVLRKVAPSDSGIYKCLIRVKAGGKNCQKSFRLNISGISLLINSENHFGCETLYIYTKIHKTLFLG